MAFRLSTDLFQHLKDVALSNAVAACLAMSYDSREAVALGYFKILLRFLEVCWWNWEVTKNFLSLMPFFKNR